jgi:hypothetical protein
MTRVVPNLMVHDYFAFELIDVFIIADTAQQINLAAVPA